jgi:glucosamine-6-phosphate deaminase
MGIKTILKARAVHLLGWGQHKATVLKKAIEGPITAVLPASFLQKHPNVRFHLDVGAAEELTRFESPWLVGICNWDDDLVCKAVVWLSQKAGKPILKLTSEDYNENGLSDLVVEYASAYDINITIFNRLQHTITGWPGGKPNADDSTRPERAKPAKKRVIIFSPHPDDDVISMGGTFIRLVEQKHDVHVAYQTSGNIAVHDFDALRYIEFMLDMLEREPSSKENEESIKKYKKIAKYLGNKKADELDNADVRAVRGLIRRGEARGGARFSGIDDDHILPDVDHGAANDATRTHFCFDQALFKQLCKAVAHKNGTLSEGPEWSFDG